MSLFVDGCSSYALQKELGWFFDPRKLLTFLVEKYFQEPVELIGAFWYDIIYPKLDRKAFHDALLLMNFTVRLKVAREFVSENTRYYKVSNLEMELAIDMLNTLNLYNCAVLVSGCFDYDRAIEVLKKNGVYIIMIGSKSKCTKAQIELVDSFIELKDIKAYIQK